MSERCGFAGFVDELAFTGMSRRLSNDEHFVQAERLDPRRIIPENESLLELHDNEVVAAAVMLTLVAADTYSPMDKSLGDRIRNFRLPGMAR